MKREDLIKKRLGVIRTHYDLDELLKHKTDGASVARYYRMSDFFYNVIHSGGGHNIHMALSEDGSFRREDFRRQAEFVANYIGSGTRKVLEVGAGRCANTKYLAGRFPEVSFTALDIANRGFLRTRVPSNVSLVEGDYHDLSGFESGSFDVVFAVETICHSANKKKVIGELSRVLKRGGRLVIFDVYEPLPHGKMSEFDRRVSAITLAGMRVTPEDQYIGDTERYLRSSGFSNVAVTDLTKRIRPNLRRLERISEIYFDHPRLARVLRSCISEDVTINSVAGYLMRLTFDGRTIHQYNRVVGRKI